MRVSFLLGLSACCLAFTPPAYADHDRVVDCSRRSLADAVADARENDPVIAFTGVCAGPIVIQTDGLTLQGVGAAVIDGGGTGNALTIAGAGRVVLTAFEVRNGINGIVAANGAHVAMSALSVHDNFVFGISLETGSSATVSGAVTSSSNGVFGINVNGSSLTVSHGTITVTGNTLGMQIATNSNAFLNDAASSISANNNLSTGLTVVSGAHLVSFGGTIAAANNPVAGVTVNSKAGLDLDAASQLNTSFNGDGLVVQEASVMTVFNTPQFSGAPGFSTINAHDNTRNGVRILSGSTLTLVNQARVNSNGNGLAGFVADNGSGVTLVNSAIAGNAVRDLELTFGARATVNTTTFATYTCDATVLVRGGNAIVCPH